MSLLEIIHSQVLPGVNLLDGATSATDTTNSLPLVSPTDIPHLDALNYPGSCDLLEQAFQTCPVLCQEMTTARNLALAARDQLIPISSAQAPMVQAFLGLACYVAGPSLRPQARYDAIKEVVDCLCPNPPQSEEEILRTHFTDRWPSCTSSNNDLLDILINELAQFCRDNQIAIYPKITLPDTVVAQLYSVLDIVERDMPREAHAIRSAESTSREGRLYKARQKPAIPSRIVLAQNAFGKDTQYLGAQYDEVRPLLPLLIARGEKFSENIKGFRVLNTSNSGNSKLEVVTLTDGRVFLRKTYLNGNETTTLRTHGLVCQGLANTIRFSYVQGDDAPEIFAIDQNTQGEWRVYMEYCEHGDLFSFMQKPANRQNPNDILGMGYLFLDLLKKAEERGIHHRDVKLQNVFIRRLPTGTQEARYVLGDYDLSMRFDEANLHHNTKLRAGTHLAPETKAERVSTGIAFDVFAAGACLVELYYGQSSARDRHTSIPVLNKAGIPSKHPFSPIIDKATRAHPEARYKSMNDMFLALETAIINL